MSSLPRGWWTPSIGGCRRCVTCLTRRRCGCSRQATSPWACASICGACVDSAIWPNTIRNGLGLEHAVGRRLCAPAWLCADTALARRASNASPVRSENAQRIETVAFYTDSVVIERKPIQRDAEGNIVPYVYEAAAGAMSLNNLGLEGDYRPLADVDWHEEQLFDIGQRLAAGVLTR